MKNGNRGVLLLSLPWQLSNWPSAALGTLKAVLSAHDVPVTVRHLHLEVAHKIGVRRYHDLAERESDVAESLFSSLFAPSDTEVLLARATERLRAENRSDLLAWVATSAPEDLRVAVDECLADVDFDRYWLCGLTIGAVQLCASVYVAHLIRTRAPHLHVIAGGAGITGEAGKRLLEATDLFDAVVDGEGERAIVAIAELGSALSPDRTNDVPNLWMRGEDGQIVKTATASVELDEMPLPDYSDYHDAVRRLHYPAGLVTIPIEASRGCAWEHRCGDGTLKGCTFCGIFRTSPNYREKSLNRVLWEIEELTGRAGVLDIGFVDAYLPPSLRHALLRHLAADPRDFSIWCELRCDFDDTIALLLADAGLKKAQLGVEAFHTSILRRIDKGTRAIDNVYALRLCEERGLVGQYNLITYYPGVPADEIEEMADSLPQLFGLRPPSVAEFYLDRGSRVYQHPEQYGLSADDVDHEAISYLPTPLGASRITQYVPFRREALGAAAIRAWDTVHAEAARWRETYKYATTHGLQSPLTYREGVQFLEVTDARSASARTLRLEGEIADVFRACRTPTSASRLATLVDLPHARAMAALQRLRDERLVFRDDHLYVTLPARARRPSGLPRTQVGRSMDAVRVEPVAPETVAVWT